MMFGSRSGRGFGGTIDYAVDKNGRRDKDARIIGLNGVDVDFDEHGRLQADDRQLARSFRIQAMMNPDVKKCVKHLWISYMPDDLLMMVNNEFKGKRHFNTIDDAIDALGQQRISRMTNKAMREDAYRLLKELHYDKTQYLIVRHSEKDNPHFHIVLNMVDNEGRRLKDFQEKRRGIKICETITRERHYGWGDHKSVAKTLSNIDKENVRSEICKVIFDITKICPTARELQMAAEQKGIAVRYTTDSQTGYIRRIGFAKGEFKYPDGKVDASLAAKRLFPSQVESDVSQDDLSLEEQNIVKEGGVVEGFNDQTVSPAVAPKVPQWVQEARRRSEYHKAIGKAEKDGNRVAYIQNIAGLALDGKCGTIEERADDVAVYVTDGNEGQDEKVKRIKDIIGMADNEKAERKSLFSRFMMFLQRLIAESMTFKEYPIIENEGRDRMQWNDIRTSQSGTLVGLAEDIKTVIEEEYNYYMKEKKREAMEEEKIQPIPKPEGTKRTERQKPAARIEKSQHNNQKIRR